MRSTGKAPGGSPERQRGAPAPSDEGEPTEALLRQVDSALRAIADATREREDLVLRQARVRLAVVHTVKRLERRLKQRRRDEAA